MNNDFDRRRGDVRITSLDQRATGIEARVTHLELSVGENTRELKANTVLTKQVHEALFGREGDEDDPGLKGKVKEMHDIFTDAQSGFRMASHVADGITKLGKPVIMGLGFFAALAYYVKTGEWKLPAWWPQ